MSINMLWSLQWKLRKQLSSTMVEKYIKIPVDTVSKGMVYWEGARELE